MDGPQPIGEINVLLQQIELEEMTMMEVSDDALEATVRVFTGVGAGDDMCTSGAAGSCGGV